jgi:hypothetical protein
MIFSPFLSIPLFFVMLLLLEAGRRFKVRTGLEPSATIENADFALFGLLLAFTLSGAIGRFDEHRSLATDELNAIDTAYHRLDLLPPETQPPIRQLFRDYVTSRLNQYETSDHSVSPESRRLQEEIWKESAAAASMSQPNPNSATLVLLPALNNMLDITNTRRNAFNMHPTRRCVSSSSFPELPVRIHCRPRHQTGAQQLASHGDLCRYRVSHHRRNLRY